jgi:hypothetical protein
LDASGADASTLDATVIDGGGGDAALSIDSGEADSGIVLGSPISGLSPGAWTWVDFADSACDDGSPTGIGINTSTRSGDVLIFLNGGGACWDADTCLVLNTAVHGPFGRTQFEQLIAGIDTSTRSHAVTLFSRTSTANIFRDWTYVFVPYCTGDVHAGDNVTTYQPQGQAPRPYHHVGHRNFVTFASRLAPTFPHPDRLVVSGSSAGGSGAVLNYLTARTYWPSGKAYLLDDSGPLFGPNATPSGYLSAWLSEWHMAGVLDPLCGTACESDLSLVYAALSRRYPNDRMALLETLQDKTIRGYLLLTAGQFQQALLGLAMTVLDATSFKYFFVSGSTHTMLGNMTAFETTGVPLTHWLAQEVTDDPTWSSLKP